MAIWQYQLNIIPKKSIIEKYGELPEKLFIDFDGWENYWKNRTSGDGFPEPKFEDAKTIKWWLKTNLNIEKIAKQFDLYVKRGDWSDDDSGFIGWKGNSELNEDNDAHISYNKETKIISEFQFRTDLRTKENLDKFLRGILKICADNELMVFNTKGYLFEPDFQIIIADLKKSNAAAFLTDPVKFLDKLAEKNNEANLKEKASLEKQINLKEDSFWFKIKSLFK
ncbi:hypothetical protein FLGE108171_15335 [Flavobacterium gelidilacus]|uniref:hypothetical protein n=1 Tax=Flavobacterium gelidilacus TaxID=206041 RepID=UPI000402B8BE|nr:hypothetical protein [Flavobacterium gelidilacus]